MKETKEFYVFGGYVNLSAGLGYIMYKKDTIKLDKLGNIEGEQICFKSKKFPHSVGQIIEVTTHEDERFSHKSTDKYIDDKISEKLRLESIAAQERHQQKLDEKKEIALSKKIDNMTIAEIREHLKESPSLKYVIGSALRRALQ